MDIDAMLNCADPSELADAVMDFYEDLEARVVKRGLDAVPDSVSAAYLVLAADEAMNHDGTAVLHERQLSEVAVDALRSLGAERLADVLEAGLAVPGGGASIDEWAREVGVLDDLIANWVGANAADFHAL